MPEPITKDGITTLAAMSRLPLWARRRIAQLERDLAHFKAIRGAVESGTTKVSLGSRLLSGVQYLPDDQPFTFAVRGDMIDVYIRKESDGDVLDVRSQVALLSVRPEAANSIQVVPRR